MIKGQQNYALSTRQQKLIVKDFMILENGGRCYSGKMKSHDFSDCYKASGPAGKLDTVRIVIFTEMRTKHLRIQRNFIRTGLLRMNCLSRL